MKVQSWITPTLIKHGPGSLKTIGEEIKRLGGRKALIVTDAGVVKAGLLQRLTAVLEEEKIPYRVFSEVVGNPPVELVGRGTAAYKESEADILIALGGGSSIDTAKAIGVEVVHGDSILNYEYGKQEITNKIPPLIAIPTTAGTGSEVTLWAVITDPARKIKFNVGGTPLIAPAVALIDPELMLDLPANLTAWTGMDALSHAIECYTCAYAQPITDAVALMAIELIAQNLRKAVAYGHDLEARYNMAMAACLAGMSYGTESAGAIHAMAQTFGGYIDVHHGYLTAVMMPVVMEYNWMGCPEKYARIALAMGEDIRGLKVEEAAKLAIKAVKELVADLEIPPLSSTGVTREDIPFLARLAFEDPQTIGNPRDLTYESYVMMYEKLLAV
ncbi:choline dehydrogenase [Thermanaeromonas toyohensis ToBE]|uniref:Choline dehydrogenase n=1 Tax=Thermanaeromonas toyohensis ToBE TaxID=698762 RepID=A0A1W1W1E9_9FIRM|nr:iron-containing alcohol dehydrogenase [Thermanaeromonas toyohensis]SMB99343.1 choline dehydrogenase [Thermanaeromonas toyohensis ToBE]